MNMADSLSNFIAQAGGKASEALQNKVNDVLGLKGKEKVEGAEKHSGVLVSPSAPGQITTRNPGLKDDLGISHPAGFTPISYYRTSASGESVTSQEQIGEPEKVDEKIQGVKLKVGEFKNIDKDLPTTPQSKFESSVDSWRGFDDGQSLDFKYGLEDKAYSKNWPGGKIPDRIRIPEGDYSWQGGDAKDDKKSWQENQRSIKDNIAEGTPFENEDPVYFGFEMEIDAYNSPLINGQAREFVKEYGQAYEQISSRLDILDSFVHELGRFFTFNTTKPLEQLNSIFSTVLPKKHYLKKIEGLDKLIEANTVSTQNAFVKYKGDTLKLSFYEDTNLSTGTLAALYKLLYWDRLRGKNMIPENLLRFDCKIVISEARNIARIRRALGSNTPNLQVVRENVSRYVYTIYECQFNFPKLTHPSAIDLSQTPAYSGEWDIELSFKYSSMSFERFVFNNGDPQNGKYKKISNISINPSQISPEEATNAVINGQGILPIASDETPVILEDLIDGYNNFDTEQDAQTELQTASGTVNQSEDILGDAKKRTLKEKFKEAIKGAGDNLVKNLKKAALSEAQRQINNKFRLLNNTIDNVRNKFGVGRMSPPTNVYEGAQPGTFFFDVKNSLRNFAGETLTNTIFGK